MIAEAVVHWNWVVLTAGFVLQVYYKQRDYWPFVWCVRYISPHLASHVEQVRMLPVMCSVVFKHVDSEHCFYPPFIYIPCNSVR